MGLYFTWQLLLLETSNLEHQVYMNDLVDSMLELVFSSAFMVGATAAFCCNREQKLL